MNFEKRVAFDDRNTIDLKKYSFRTYSTDLYKGPTESLERSLKGKRQVLLPDFPKLFRGDVILTKPKNRRPHSSEIVKKQKSIGRFDDQYCEFTHASIYLGQMHVAESVPIHFELENLKRLALGEVVISGLRIVPITQAIKNCDFEVFRVKGFEEDGKIPERSQVAQYSLLDHASFRRKYNNLRIVEISTKGRLRKISQNLNRYRSLEKSIICSEYVLECLALGAGFSADRFFELENKTRKTDKDYFYPADFTCLEGMKKVKLETVNVTLP